MVVGEETPDEGAVSVPKKLTIGYFRQDVEELQGRSVLDEAIAGSGRVGDLHHELEALQREMADPDKADDMDRILDRFGHVQEEYAASLVRIFEDLPTMSSMLIDYIVYCAKFSLKYELPRNDRHIL